MTLHWVSDLNNTTLHAVVCAPPAPFPLPNGAAINYITCCIVDDVYLCRLHMFIVRMDIINDDIHTVLCFSIMNAYVASRNKQKADVNTVRFRSLKNYDYNI